MRRHLELDNGLIAGYVNNQGLQVGECYSGGDCHGDVTGATSDQTPEEATTESDGVWSVMSERPDVFETSRTAFSIEELTTIDFEDIPSVDD